MIRDRIGDEPRKGSLPADTATASVAYEYLAWATVWLLVGTVAGLVPAVKLHWAALFGILWPFFGRGRPDHTTTGFVGLSQIGVFGPSVFGLCRHSRAPRWRAAL